MKARIRFLIPIIIIAMVLAAPLTIPVQAQTAPSLDIIKDRVQKAYNYITALKRDMGYYAAISEYPSIPIVVYDPSHGWWWIPGLKYYISQTPYGSSYLHVVIRDSSIVEGYYGTSYTWYMDLRLYSDTESGNPDDVTYATLYVKEYRGYPYSYVYIKVTYSIIDSWNAKIYVAGEYIGTVKQGSSYTKTISDSPYPSMRTSVRHVDVIGALTLANLAGYYTHEDIWNLAQAIMFNVFQTDKPLYDIYNSMLQGFTYTGLIDAPNEWHFYDAQWFSYGLGYSKIWEFFKDNGWIWTTYPLYPYKSKVVSYAEATHQNGGWWFLFFDSASGDPLYHAWWGLWYAYQGDYSKALQEWNYVKNAWDGNGIVFSGQTGYSTVRLATALALGSILAGKGYISWDIPDQMASVLVQLQWTGSGHYSPDGSNVYWVAKPDHIGGFIVSYGPIGSYGYVPFRPSLIEDIIEAVGDVMEPEYGGIIPTNAEATLLSMIALMQYAYYKYGVTPSQLLS